MTGKDVRRGIAYEKRVAKRNHAEHVGGPGKEDYRRGAIKGEVKATKAKMTKPALMKLIKEKDINQVDTINGFTSSALKYCQKYRPEVKLTQKKRVIKPRTCSPKKKGV